MIVSVKTLSRVAKILGDEFAADAQLYDSLALEYTQVLHDNFWDESRQIFDEFYVDESGVKHFDGHLGYLNFFPFFLGLLEPSEQRFELMARQLLNRDSGIWSDFGIRSISTKDSYYRKGDNYWTSPIWMSINYLIVTSLYQYSNSADIEENLRSEIKEAYEELRINLIDAWVS